LIGELENSLHHIEYRFQTQLQETNDRVGKLETPPKLLEGKSMQPAKLEAALNDWLGKVEV